MKLLYCTDIFDAAVQHAGRIDICSAVGGESDWLTAIWLKLNLPSHIIGSSDVICCDGL